MSGVSKIAAHIVDANTGDHILVGPALNYGQGPAFVVVVGGKKEGTILEIVCAEANDLDEARAWRDEVFAELMRLAVSPQRDPPLMLHNFEDDRDLIKWACEVYPCPRLEGLRSRILGGGTA